MKFQNKDFVDLRSPLRKRLSRISGFTLFIFGIMACLGGGNFFFDYTEALHNVAKIEVEEVEEEVEIAITINPPREIYTPLFLAYDEKTKEIIQKTKFIAATLNPLPSTGKQRGVYIHMNHIADETIFNAKIKQINNSKMNAIVFDVKGSYVYFHSNSKIAQENNLIKPLYDLPEVVKKLRADGIYTIARVIAIKDPKFALQNPELRLHRSKKSDHLGDRWVKPEHPKVTDYNHEIVKEIIEAGVDEINLDFIRYPTELGNDFLGISAEDKVQNLEVFLQMVRNTIDRLNPNVQLSINTFAILGWNYEENVVTLGQDVLRFTKYVDIIAPMIYPSTFKSKWYYNPRTDKGGRIYTIVKKTLMGYADILGEDAVKLRPWLQGYVAKKEEALSQIRGVFDAGYCGFMFWEGKNDYALTYRALKMVEVPENCK